MVLDQARGETFHQFLAEGSPAMESLRLRRGGSGCQLLALHVWEVISSGGMFLLVELGLHGKLKANRGREESSFIATIMTKPLGHLRSYARFPRKIESPRTYSRKVQENDGRDGARPFPTVGFSNQEPISSIVPFAIFCEITLRLRFSGSSGRSEGPRNPRLESRGWRNSFDGGTLENLQ